MQGLNQDECLLYTCVVWITLALSPACTVVRWATKGAACRAVYPLFPMREVVSQDARH